MFRKRIYYTIFETETHLEYHVSASKQEVLDHKSMSRAIPLNPKKAMIEAKKEWHRDADLHNAIFIK